MHPQSDKTRPKNQFKTVPLTRRAHAIVRAHTHIYIST